MYDDDGRLNAQAIAEVIGETPSALARAFGVKPDTVRKNPKTDLIQAEAGRFVFLLEQLHLLFGEWRSVMIWLRKPHPALDNISPLDVILKERDLTSIIGMAMRMREGILG